jgi:hypothetical protein
VGQFQSNLSSSSSASFDFVKQWRWRGWHGGFLDDQSCAIQSVDRAVKPQRAVIEGVEFGNVGYARSRKMNGVRRFQS